MLCMRCLSSGFCNLQAQFGSRIGFSSLKGCAAAHFLNVDCWPRAKLCRIRPATFAPAKHQALWPSAVHALVSRGFRFCIRLVQVPRG